MLGVQRSDANEINALNFLDQTYQRRPLLPYLCVMAGRSEMSLTHDEDIGAEALLTQTAEKMARMHAEGVEGIAQDKELTHGERMKLIEQAAKAGCGIGALLRTGRKLIADLDALKAVTTVSAKAAAKAPVPVKGVANEETEMNDDSGRTPERMAELHTDIRRRLDAARAARESKQVAGRGGAPTDRALPGGVEACGGAPEPAA